MALPERPNRQAPQFARFVSIQRLGEDRSGHASVEHARHQLYVGRDTRTRTDALIKVITRPGLVYEHNLTNEISTLSTIKRELPDSPYFPSLWDHGRLPDGRVFVIMSLFDEWPLATTIGAERIAHRLVARLKTSLEVAKALEELHRIQVFHVDLNPMNILYRAGQDTALWPDAWLASDAKPKRYSKPGGCQMRVDVHGCVRKHRQPAKAAESRSRALKTARSEGGT